MSSMPFLCYTLLQDKSVELGVADRLVLATICGFMSPLKRMCFPSYETIARAAGLSRDYVRKDVIPKLVKSRWIRTRTRWDFGAKRNKTNLFFLGPRFRQKAKQIGGLEVGNKLDKATNVATMLFPLLQYLRSNDELKAKERLAMFAIVCSMDKNLTCSKSLPFLAEVMGCTVRHVRTCVRELEKRGLISRTEIAGKAVVFRFTPIFELKLKTIVEKGGYDNPGSIVPGCGTIPPTEVIMSSIKEEKVPLELPSAKKGKGKTKLTQSQAHALVIRRDRAIAYMEMVGAKRNITVVRTKKNIGMMFNLVRVVRDQAAVYSLITLLVESEMPEWNGKDMVQPTIYNLMRYYERWLQTPQFKRVYSGRVNLGERVPGILQRIDEIEEEVTSWMKRQP